MDRPPREWRVHFVEGKALSIFSARFYQHGKWTGGELIAQDYDVIVTAMLEMKFYRAAGPQEDGALEVWLDQ